MKKILLPFLLVFSLATGIISGIAYENITKALNFEADGGKKVEVTDGQEAVDNSNENEQQTAKTFVGSRNSNKFYPVDCRFAKLIKEENKVFFETVADGEELGRKYVECK
jgi:hypothetical protein